MSLAVPEIFVIKVGGCIKSTEILHVSGLRFFFGEDPKFSNLHYKIQPVSDHVAKFHGDRPRYLGERVAKKNIMSKIEDLPYYRTGGLTINATVFACLLIAFNARFCNV